MKNKIIITLLVIVSSLTSMAQVGIGTTTPNASAKLDVTSTSQGFLPPRVALTATSDATTIKNAAGTSITPATGLFVYNTATAGLSPSNVTPGLYYYDGSKWQRIINQQPDATIEFDKATPTTASVVFTPNTPASKDYVYVSTIDNSQWTYNGSIYTTYTPPASTAWNLAGGTTDAGSNKTGAISRTGNVGVGPTTPPIYGGYTSMALSNATNGGVFDFMNGSNRVGTIYNDASKLIIGTVGVTPNTIPLVFIAGGSGSERMRITGTGNVGIGDNSPAFRFSVFNNISGEYAARIYNGANSGTAHGLLIRAGSNGTPFGAVMIGFANIDGAVIGSITQNAAFTVSYNTSSDRRLKNNIVNTHFGINDLMKIQVRDYVYKADAGKTLTTGFIAQELYDIFPNAVSKPAKAEDMWSVDYGKVTPLLVKAIQDQQTTIEAQQKQINELKRMVEMIMKK